MIIFYHNVGDTVWGHDTIYHYQWWHDNWIHHDEDSASHAIMTNEIRYGQDLCGGINMMYHYTPTPISVIGLAGVVLSWDGDGTTFPFVFFDSTEVPEYFVLYDATADSLVVKASVQWHPSDPHRTMLFERHLWNSNNGCDLRYDSNFYPLYEYYFEDKPITITDSFYVGGTYHSYIANSENMGIINHNKVPIYVALGEVPLNASSPCQQLPMQHYIFIPEKSNPPYIYAGTVMHRDEKKVMAVFPILAIDTSFAYPDTVPYVCSSVENLRLADISDNTVTMMWNSNEEHQSWQVSLVRAGESPENGIIDSVISQPFFVMTGLDTCVSYSLYVRAVCEHRDSLYYSQWSDSMLVNICDTTTHDPMSFFVADQSDWNVSIIPNPAGKRVSVMSGFGIQRIEVYGTNGVKQADMEATGHAAYLEVGKWPKGHYIVVVHHSAGIETKNLVVN